MAAKRLSRPQHRTLVWLAAEVRCTRGTMAASHQDLVRALAHDRPRRRLGEPGVHTTRAWLIVALRLTLTSPAMAGHVRCTTYEQKTMNQLHTVCDDGTKAISTYSRTLQRWETTITESPRQTCTGRLNPHSPQVEVRCR